MKLYFLGLALLVITSLDSAKADTNLVSNPGFEDGSAISPGIGNFSAPDWSTQTAPTGSYFYVGDENPHSGANEVDFGAAGGELDYISQTLTTVVGTTYDISFYLSVSNVEDGVGEQTPSNEFVASMGGTLVGSPTTFDLTGTNETEGGADNYISDGTTLTDVANATDSSYTEYTGTFQAVDTSTNLIFGSLNGPSLNYLDDVSVTASQATAPVPEPSQYGMLLLASCALIAWRRFSAPVRLLARI